MIVTVFVFPAQPGASADAAADDRHGFCVLGSTRCQRITVSGWAIASASYVLGNRRPTAPNISLSIEVKGGRLGRVRRRTLICCLRPEFLLPAHARPQKVDHHSKDQSAQI